jgi:hypothetical protein
MAYSIQYLYARLCLVSVHMNCVVLKYIRYISDCSYSSFYDLPQINAQSQSHVQLI